MKEAFVVPVALIVFGIFAYLSPLAHAQSVSDIQSQINQHNSQIAELQAEIAQYQKQLDSLATQKNTLQSTINTLSIQQKQLAAQLQVTQNKISAANLEISELTSSIGTKQETITSNQTAIAAALRDSQITEDVPVSAQLFSAQNFSDAWSAVDAVEQFNRALEQDISNLQDAQMQLSNNRDAVTATKASLVLLQTDLSSQKRSIDANAAAQQQLLAQTKNQEANYQKLLTQKKASEQSFEQELMNLESQLNLIVNPGSLPKVGSGVLSWPFSTLFMQNCAKRQNVFSNPYCITQYFGNTDFATQNPQVYNGMGHDGLDIGAPIGTPVEAALSGIILGTGNTDLSHDSKGNQCYSFGKWVMIKHTNGLNTLYAHLSEIDVSAGESVQTGQVLGLSGETGYATGPHLHFGVYATDGTKILTLNQFRGATTPCANATMPVATVKAYLNPLSYL